jgi:hypothetical protein
MFGRLTSMYKLSEASGIVKEVLLSLPLPMLPFDADALSTKLVAVTYNTKPDLFDGKLGKRPHRVATAAVALAEGLSYEGYEFARTARQVVFLALGNILLSATANASRYGFTQIDMHMIRLAQAAYLDHEEKTREATTAVVGSLGL